MQEGTHYMYGKVNFAVLSVLLLIAIAISNDFGYTHPRENRREWWAL